MAELTPKAEAGRLRAALGGGELVRSRVELAAWLGYAPAREALGDAAPPCGCLDWTFEQLLPSVTMHRLEDAGLLPEVDRDNGWPQDEAARAVLAWARAALPALTGEALAGAESRVEAAGRYLVDRRPENDISRTSD